MQDIGFVWETEDPFLFCVHHEDYYPKGNDDLGPTSALTGRRLGQDFDHNSQFRMYHGLTVPGFPEHPHRGFETVTVTLKGTVDHFDSLGGSGRYGNGDIQWMTAGKGIQHCEMFPLLHKDKANPLHLFQIWLNLPAKDKFVEPDYKMIWHESLQKFKVNDGGMAEVTLITGTYEGTVIVAPVANSWATKKENHVTIMIVTMGAGAKVTLANMSETSKRNLYFYKGSSLTINGEQIDSYKRVSLANIDVEVTNTGQEAAFLYLAAEPINEPVQRYGPFVMNTMEEIQEAYGDYEKTQFGGWPWDRSDPVHTRDVKRMAKYSDGEIDMPI